MENTLSDIAHLMNRLYFMESEGRGETSSTKFCPSVPTAERKANNAILHSRMSSFDLGKIDRSVKRDLGRGWLIPYLLEMDAKIWGRWEYWFHLMALGSAGSPKELPIPEIWFESSPHGQTMKMLEQCLNCIPTQGEWRGWSSSLHFDYFLDWLLWGLGHRPRTDGEINPGRSFDSPRPPVEPWGCEGASDRLYQVFQLGAMQIFPYDYFGDIMAEMRFGKHNGFYPTPMSLVTMMVQMTMMPSLGQDLRLATVCDPCVGTGRMPLLASNHSLRLYAQDISLTCVKCSLVNAALYAPWWFKPLPFLDRHWPEDEEALSEGMTQVAPGHLAVKQFVTKYDPTESNRHFPMKVRSVVTSASADQRRTPKESTVPGLTTNENAIPGPTSLQHRELIDKLFENSTIPNLRHPPARRADYSQAGRFTARIMRSLSDLSIRVGIESLEIEEVDR